MTGTATLPEHKRERGARRKSEVAIRIASAVVLATIALGATLAQPWTFLVLVMIGGGIIAWEWGRLTRGNGSDGTFMVATVSVAAIAVLVFLRRPDYALLLLAVTAAAIGYSTYATGLAAWSVAGLIYAALPTAALVWLRDDTALGLTAILFLFAVAWTTDTASYVAGRLIGGSKLAPGISPKKTWSGFLVGTVTPALVGYVFASFLEDTSPPALALVSVALALACQMGDLVESWVKRRFGAKDMSQLIPGHGGLLDRIDGLLFAAVLAGLIALRNPASPGHGLLIW